MSALDRPGSTRRGVTEAQAPRIGRPVRSLWQCPPCLRWNRQSAETCSNCARPRPAAPDRLELQTMTEAMIDRLRELLRAATPGPWRIGFSDGSGRDSIIAPETRRGTRLPERTVIRGGQDGWGVPLGVEEPDAALIVEAVNALPELLDAHDRMAGALRMVRVSLKGARGLALDHDETALDTEFALAIDVIDEALPRAALAVPKEENPDA